jgi:hypothetical protein
MKRHTSTPLALGMKVRGERGMGRRNAVGTGNRGNGVLAAMPAPLPIPPVDHDKVVQDLLVATLFRVRQTSNRSIALSCEKWMERILSAKD